MNRSIRRSLIILGLTGLAMGGCYSPGGSGFSDDTHSYPSTSWEPKTVTLKDTRTGQEVWSYDVPVGKKLVVRFRAGMGIKGSGTPDLMEWKLMENEQMSGQLDNSVPVPGPNDRRLDLTLRPTPELPEAMGGGIPRAASDHGG